VDAGCGNADILLELAPYFLTLYGIDYSTSMIEEGRKKISGKGFSNIQLFHSDILEIDTIIPSKADGIICYEVVQFLDKSQLKDFVSKCRKILNEDGRILLLNILDAKCFDLYSIGFYREEGRIQFTRMISHYLRMKFYFMRKKLRNPSFVYDGGIGYWYSVRDIKEIAESAQLNCDICYSMFPPYGYRFHAILTNKSND
jgi:ubiquinone/menaquinone biosynthesis C-methylase UbiE